ncbi:MAG TPA: hypothetical protein VJH23_00970 [archaeon]|nr:hypothetical protein [archaeon]
MDEDKIHFSRPPTAAQVKSALRAGHAKIFMPASSFTRISARARKLLESSNAEVIIESSRGRPIEIGVDKLMQIIELHRDNRTFRQIEQSTGIPKSTVHYLVKYAERQKLRKGGKIVYL